MSDTHQMTFGAGMMLGLVLACLPAAFSSGEPAMAAAPTAICESSVLSPSELRQISHVRGIIEMMPAGSAVIRQAPAAATRTAPAAKPQQRDDKIAQLIEGL